MNKIISRAGFTVLIDIAGLACFISLAASGFILAEMLEEGAAFTGAKAGAWGEIHEGLFKVFVIIMAAHILLHLKMFISRIRNLFSKGLQPL
ncbi:MAG: DUF4405 domain-containing protein [Elusimicrobiota bacterium]